MATQTTNQQNALKDAMARAKQIAAKLQQHGNSGETAEPEEKRKRAFNETALLSPEPVAKRNANNVDPKVIAQQLANSLVQRPGVGSMLVEEVTIPSKLVGLVIGRGGEMINKLQSESGAKIQIAPDPPQDAGIVPVRQITITGTMDAVNKAKELIGEIRNNGKIPERLMGGTLPGEFSVEMNIASGKVGLVIGKGGETIKSLQERAGCKMVLFQSGEYANALEKPLRISGEQAAVMYGKQLVQDLLTMKELESRGRRTGGNFGPRGPQAPWGSNPPQNVAQDAQPNNGPGGPRPGWGAPGQQGPGGPRGWNPQGPRPFGGGNDSDNPTQQPGWGQQAQSDRWNQPGGPGWNQQQPGSQQPTWDPQQQQWQQPNQAPQGQWPNQQFPWGQQGQPARTPAPQNAPQSNQPAATNPAAQVDPAHPAAPQTQGQPDYSAAWALYYQQQSQYYQQYAMQQSSTGATAATTTPATGTAPLSANNPQAQAMAEYQAKLAEYYKSVGQHPPQ